MEYLIKTVDGAEIPINEKQFKDIVAEEESGSSRIYIKGAWLRLNTFNIYQADQIPITEGYLSDGTKVIKKFGEWVDALNPDVRLDPRYYPEIAKALVKRTREGTQEALAQFPEPDQPLQIDGKDQIGMI